MVLRSRSAPLVTALSSAVSQVRSHRGCTSRRIARLAWNRSRVSSDTERDSALVNPDGLTTKLATARWASSPPRTRRLIVSTAAGASPVNRLLMLTPSSTSSPRPVDRSASMTAASAGLFATITLSLARSYQRKAGIPSMTPCRMPIWLAGVVAGSLGVHSAIVWLPDRIHRVSVGTVPAETAIWSTGNGTPSIWTNSTPSTSGSSTSTGRRRWVDTSRPTSTWEVPALPIQPRMVPTRPTTMATTRADQ